MVSEATTTHEPVIDAVAEIIKGTFSSLLQDSVIRALATEIVVNLVDDLGAIPPTDNCQRGAPEYTASCEHPAVWGHNYCLFHIQ